MVAELKVKINVGMIKDRLAKTQAKTKAHVIPVIKNNANGLGFKQIFEAYKKSGVKMVAAAYAREFLKYDEIKNDTMGKLAWTWNPNEPEYSEVTNLTLVCKNFEQLAYCIKNKIPYHIAFNIVMNRGGFTKEDFHALYEIVSDNPITITAHCPYENKDDILGKYKPLVEDLYESLMKYGFNIHEGHFANSAVFRSCEDLHADYVRLGEELLLNKPDEGYVPVTYETYVMAKVKIPKGGNIAYDALKAPYDINAIIVPIGYYHVEKIDTIRAAGMDHKAIWSMHDSTVVEFSGDDKVFDKLKEYEPVTFYNSYDGNGAIQRYFKLNEDLVEYEYSE